jgi:hypothetical protein
MMHHGIGLSVIVESYRIMEMIGGYPRWDSWWYGWRGVMGGLHSRGLVANTWLALYRTIGELIMGERLVRDLDTSVVKHRVNHLRA